MSHTRRAASLMVFAAGLILIPAAPASAHAALLTTSPPAGYSVSSSPTQLTLIFNEPVTIHGQALTLHGQARGPIPLSTPAVADAGRRLSARPDAVLPPGRYTVDWQVVADDGDIVTGSVGFAVGIPAATGGDARAAGTRGLVTAAVLRWLLFTGLALVLGGAVGAELTGRTQRRTPAGETVPAVAPLLRSGSLLGFTAAVGLAVHLLGDGSIADGLRRLSLSGLADTVPGRITLVEALGFAVAVGLATLRRPRGLIVVPMVAVVGAEAWRSHLTAAAPDWGALVTAIHLTAAAIWVGTLLHVVRVAARMRHSPLAVRALLAGYSRIALGLFLVVVATGTLTSIELVPNLPALLHTGYGRVLLVKLGLVTLTVALALAARRHLARTRPTATATATATGPGTVPDTGRPAGAARIERTALVGVLALTGLLVSMTPAAPISTDLAFPPPPDGPTLRLASLAGQVTVAIAASDGQLEVRLAVPEDTPTSQPHLRLTAELTAAGVRRTLTVQRCGTGCYLAPVSWASPDSQLTLHTTADGWTGGTTTLTIPWPPASDATLLTQVIDTMRAVESLTLHETVTSNTAAAAPSGTDTPMSGERFLDVEPYGAAAPTDGTILSRRDGHTQLAFALVPSRFYFVLDVGTDHRILHETITAPGHLLARTFD
ncbi:copper resistance CopC/CopD family protein, partial [Frankia sp. Cr1]|uniref:copper resistance CopC/CopD family protein n=1 Tax=Frankia sp. Cr1 TaxID=3073931 RepID=UPI002AD3634D